MAEKEAILVGSSTGKENIQPSAERLDELNVEGPTMGELQSERRELARDFVTLKHTIAQLRADRDRLSVENRDLKMRLAAIETDYANLFSYVEGSRAEA